jgi:hypothetical protein
MAVLLHITPAVVVTAEKVQIRPVVITTVIAIAAIISVASVSAVHVAETAG